MADKKRAKTVDPDSEYMEEVRLRYQEAIDYDRENRDQGMDDLRFLSGDQWDADVKLKRERAGRPTLTINTLPQFVGQVIGDTRINRPSIKVRPVEDADQDLADVRASLIRGIEQASDATGVYINAGEDQVSCGIGNFRVNLEYVQDDVFDQDIRFRGIANPFAVVWDPMSVERTGADARYCFVIDEVPRRAFEKQYPHVSLSGDIGSEIVAQGWVTKDVVLVAEYWEMKTRKRKIALLTDGKIEDITDKEAEYAGRIATTADGKPRVRTVERPYACMRLITGTEPLNDEKYELPISRLPIIRVEGRVVRVADKRVRFGLVRFAKDSQRLKNFWSSLRAEALAGSTKARWLLKRTADGITEDDLRYAHLSDDTVLTYDGQDKPERIDPPPYPAAFAQEAQTMTDDMKATTGLYDSSLGARSNETSGKAILARERQGDVATFMYHDNLNAAIREGGRVANELIPVVYDTARTIRIIGEDEASKLQRINDPNDPDSIDIGKGKYDVAIETGPSFSTRRVEAAESMMQFVQAVPGAAQVAGDLIAQAQDWPLAAEIGERLKKTLPPNIVGEKDEELSPEQQQEKQQAMQAAQQQQQMQMAAAQAELEGKQADTQLKQAQARKAMAEAAKAEAEANNALRGPPPEKPDPPQDPRVAEANAVKAMADAERAVIGVESDRIDLMAKPAKMAAEAQAHHESVEAQPEAEPADEPMFEPIQTAPEPFDAD